MADPQTENGYLKIAMEIVEHLGRYRIPGQEMQLLWVLLRKTWGWNKKEDTVSLSQFAKSTGIDKGKCSHLLRSLIKKNIIKNTVDQKVTPQGRKYKFNKDYETWIRVDQKVTRDHIVNKGVDQKVNKVVPQKVTTKDIYINNIINNLKKIDIDKNLWTDFLEHRKKLRRPMTNKAQEILIKRLTMLKDKGDDPVELLETAIEKGWLSVYSNKDSPEDDYEERARKFKERHKNDKEE